MLEPPEPRPTEVKKVELVAGVLTKGPLSGASVNEVLSGKMVCEMTTIH